MAFCFSLTKPGHITEMLAEFSFIVYHSVIIPFFSQTIEKLESAHSEQKC